MRYQLLMMLGLGMVGTGFWGVAPGVGTAQGQGEKGDKPTEPQSPLIKKFWDQLSQADEIEEEDRQQLREDQQRDSELMARVEAENRLALKRAQPLVRRKCVVPAPPEDDKPADKKPEDDNAEEADDPADGVPGDGVPGEGADAATSAAPAADDQPEASPAPAIEPVVEPASESAPSEATTPVRQKTRQPREVRPRFRVRNAV